jgi:hypothetical protein
MESYEQYLRDAAVPKEVIDTFLDPSSLSWARFDPEVGYVLGNSMPRDGIGGCSTISTAQPNGARTARMYSERPCRINTYGDSFTQCHQVSDSETWQEYLAAHLGEPVRNFGMGGFGVYQAYRRMLRTEQGPDGARYVVLYLWGDDHLRSIMRCRHALTYPWWDSRGGLAFHGNFWANMEMNLETSRFAEHEGRLPTPESLCRMSDPDFMVEALKDDLMAQLCSIAHGVVDPASVDVGRLNTLAEKLGVAGIDGSAPERLKASSWRIAEAYGFAATREIIEKAVDFCAEHGKDLLFLLLCPTATRQLLRGEPRYDQCIADYLAGRGLRYFDMNLVHLSDFKCFSLPVDDYLRRYFIGHYSPAGNHFFAFAIKDTIVDWLDPKPITYRDDESRTVDFRGYLPEGTAMQAT